MKKHLTNYRGAVLGVLLSVICFPSAFCQAGAPTDETAYAEKASALLKTAVEEEKSIGLAAGFSIGSEIVWEDAAGYSDLETERPFRPETLTRIASITKPMTAVAILQLHEQEKIHLDSSIQTYLPDFPVKPQGTITVRHLLSHSSGIGAYSSNKERENKKEYANLAEAAEIFQGRDLQFEPGSAFYYTTYGYVLLGLIIEKASGMSYEEYLRKNIWEVAGMDHTGVEEAGRDYPNKSALYRKNKKGKIKQARPTNLSDRIPGGGVQSCVADMLKFGQAVLNHTLLSQASLELMLTDTGLKQEGNPYGYGWYLYGRNPEYGEVAGHNGGQTGASAQLFLLPEREASIIVLSNTSGAEPMYKVSEIGVKLFGLALGGE